MRRLASFTIGIATTALAWPALAQQAAPAAAVPDGTASYPASFFAQFAPRTALDIASHVPGFSLDNGNADVRGFTGAAGNVVLNGSRPSSKAESLSTILSRIPASRVVRAEVSAGSRFGAEYSGKSQVLNLVIAEGMGGIDGTVTGSLKKMFAKDVIPNLSASVNFVRGDSRFSLAAGTERNDTIDEGTDLITDPLTGELFEKRRKVNHYRPRSPYVSASFGRNEGSNRALHLNVRFERSSEDFIQTNRVYPVDGTPRDDRLFMVMRQPAWEFGGDLSRPLAGGTVKFVGLANRRHRTTLDTVLVRDDGAVVGGYQQGSDSRLNETIGRAAWSRSNLLGLSVEIGAEGALNTLDNSLDLYEFDETGERERIDLPIDNATVREKRVEMFAKAGKQLSPSLRLDAGLNYEMSWLTVSGDTSAKRALKFLKPSLALDWKPGGGWHSNLSLRRTVAQLNFYDFISSAELSSDRVNGGNANLQPQRSWEARLSVDHPLFKDGVVKVDLGYDRIELLQDRILTEEGYDAPGNIGTGTRLFASVSIDAPLDRFGLSGTRFKFDGTLQRTRVEDPITGEMRRFSDYYPEWQWYLELRRDAGRWAYGFDLSDRDRITFFRFNELDTNFNGGVFGNAFVEYRPSQRTTVTFNVNNLFGTHGLRDRLFFIPNRSVLIPSFEELRERNSHPSATLTFKRSFGGGGTAPAP